MTDFPAFSKLGVDKFGPVDQIWPTTHFPLTYELRMIFTFFSAHTSSDYI